MPEEFYYNITTITTAQALSVFILDKLSAENTTNNETLKTLQAAEEDSGAEVGKLKLEPYY